MLGAGFAPWEGVTEEVAMSGDDRRIVVVFTMVGVSLGPLTAMLFFSNVRG